MDIFGSHWLEHEKKMAASWDKLVGDDDIVLCPGDLSWAMRLDEALIDLNWIAERKGRLKILMRGNHDYWWSSISKVRKALPESLLALQNDAIDLGDVVLAGTRGWDIPHAMDLDSKKRKIYERELQRFRLSLEEAKKIAKGRSIIVMLHYPPFSKDRKETGFSRLCEEYGAKLCIFGHLHGKEAHSATRQGDVNNIIYKLVAADYLEFSPVVLELK